MNRLTLYILLLLLTSNHAMGSETFSATVIHVWDGDSLVINTKNGPQQLRIMGIDSPEKSQPFAKESKEYLSHLLLNQTVTIKSHGKDRYHRLLVKIKWRETDIAHTMVERGLAWAYRQYHPPKTLIEKELQAKREKRGLWQQSTPTPPWKWRKEKRENP